MKVLVLMDFSKTGVGEEARGLKGEIIEISPELAEFLAERNIIEVIIEEDDEESTTWQQ